MYVAGMKLFWDEKDNSVCFRKPGEDAKEDDPRFCFMVYRCTDAD